MFVRTRAVLTVVALVLLAGHPAGADDKVARYELENGLRVILRPVSGSPSVAVLVLYDIGEDHDPAGKSGLGHFVEHCYVTSAAGETPARTYKEMTKSYPDGSNAQTGRDYTVIAVVAPPARLEQEIADAALRMGDLRVRQEDLDRERPRMLDELDNMFHAYPNLAAQNLTRERVAPSPEGARKGGVPAHVASITLADITAHHAKYYKPRNARLVIAGDFSVESAKPLVKKHFGPLPSGEAPPTARPGSTPSPGALTTHPSPRRTGQPDWAGIAYAAPRPGEDHYASFLLLVSRLLADQRGGKIPDGITPVHTVIDAPETLHVIGPVKDGESPEAAVARLRAYLQGVTTKPVGLADRGMARKEFDLLLGTMPLFDAMIRFRPYGVAFGLARRDQMGLDGLALGKALLAVDDEAFRRMCTDVLSDDKSAAAVVQLTE